MKVIIGNQTVALSAADMVKIVTGGVGPKTTKINNSKTKDHDKETLETTGRGVPEATVR